MSVPQFKNAIISILTVYWDKLELVSLTTYDPKASSTAGIATGEG